MSFSFQMICGLLLKQTVSVLDVIIFDYYSMKTETGNISHVTKKTLRERPHLMNDSLLSATNKTLRLLWSMEDQTL